MSLRPHRMTAETRRDERHRQTSGRPRRRHWRRQIAAAAVGLLIVVIVAVVLFAELQTSPAPLTLPTAQAHPAIGPLQGTWSIGTGSAAGFRLQETVLFFIRNDVVGRTSAVAGAAVISHNAITRVTISIDLNRIKVSGRTQPQFEQSLRTELHPTAVFRLDHPVSLSRAFISGATTTMTVAGQLSMNGLTNHVASTILSRRDGTMIQISGSIPILLSRWDIQQPTGFGPLGSLANHGNAEFLIVLRTT